MAQNINYFEYYHFLWKLENFINQMRSWEIRDLIPEGISPSWNTRSGKEHDALAREWATTFADRLKKTGKIFNKEDIKLLQSSITWPKWDNSLPCCRRAWTACWQSDSMITLSWLWCLIQLRASWIPIASATSWKFYQVTLWTLSIKKNVTC